MIEKSTTCRSCVHFVPDAEGALRYSDAIGLCSVFSWKRDGEAPNALRADSINAMPVVKQLAFTTYCQFFVCEGFFCAHHTEAQSKAEVLMDAEVVQ